MASSPRDAPERHTTSPRRRGRPPKVGREAVLEAGLALIRADGLEGLTVRGVAERLGVAPATLYGHFPDKDALLGAIADRAWDRFYVEVPERGRWRERLLGWLLAVRTRLRNAPELPVLLNAIPPQPAALLRTTRALGDLLVQGGFSREEAVRRAQGLVWTVVGFFVIESARARLDVEKQHRGMLARVPEEERDATEAILPLLRERGDDEIYRELAGALVRGLR